VPPQPYVHVDRNDYSLDPLLVGRRVEVRVSQREIIAAALDTGELACRHRRVFAAGQEITDPGHQQALERLRLERYRGKPPVGEDVQVRDLAVFDRLAPNRLMESADDLARSDDERSVAPRWRVLAAEALIELARMTPLPFCSTLHARQRVASEADRLGRLS